MKYIVRLLLVFVLVVISIWFVIARPFTLSFSGEENDIDIVGLREKVREISQDFSPRSSAHPEALRKLSEHIYKEFGANSSSVEFQEFTVNGEDYRNVIAKFGPSTNSVLVIGAHYDTFDNLPGADDNASGVVGLIELSRLVKNLNLGVQLQLVAYTLEEPPFFATKQMGSYIHASHLKNTGMDVELMISLEMIGYFSDEKASQKYPVSLLKYLYPTTGDFIAVVDRIGANDALKLKSTINSMTNIEAYSINAPTNLVGIDFSDHRNYWALGYPAVMVTNTAFFRNETYHTDRDTFDRLNYEKMAEVIYGVYKFVQKFQSGT